VPQDARGIIAWRAKLREIYPRTRAHWRHDLAAFNDEMLIELAHKHRAAYIVIDKTRAHRAIGLPQVYPLFAEDNPSFAVYRVPPAAE
jgi:hypothetical protein